MKRNIFQRHRKEQSNDSGFIPLDNLKPSVRMSFEQLHPKFITTKPEKENNDWLIFQCIKCGKEYHGSPEQIITCEHETGKSLNKKKYHVPCYVIDHFKNAPAPLKRLVAKEDYGQRLVEETGKRIVSEENVRENLIVGLFGGRLVINSKTLSYNQLLSEESGAGKDYVVTNVLELLPKTYWNHKTRLSEKALSYWHPVDKEPYWTWNGKILYCEDSNNSFLNCDTVKVMMTGGSDIAIVDKGQLVEKKINGSPIFVVTSATAEPNKELVRRISISQMDSTEQQTKRIVDFQTKVAAEGMPTYNQELIDSAYLLQRVEVDIPFSKTLEDSFPMNIQARTNFDRLLDLIKANAALHQHSREWKNEKRIEATLEDLEVGLRVFKRLYPTRNSSLTHAQQKLVDYLEQIKKPKSAAELFREIGHFQYTQIGKMIKGLRSLSNKGFVDIGEGEVNGKYVDVYSFIPEVSKVNIVSKVSEVTKVSENKEKEKNPLTLLTKLTPNTVDTYIPKCSRCGSELVFNGDSWICLECDKQ